MRNIIKEIVNRLQNAGYEPAKIVDELNARFDETFSIEEVGLEIDEEGLNYEVLEYLVVDGQRSNLVLGSYYV